MMISVNKVGPDLMDKIHEVVLAVFLFSGLNGTPDMLQHSPQLGVGQFI
jgi:hypothetical protein